MTTQSTESYDTILVNDVEDFIFCPRKLYLTRVLGAAHPEPARVARGKKVHVARGRWLARTGVKEFFLVSERLGVSGVVDGLKETEDRVEIYDVKDLTGRSLLDSQMVQCALYGMLAEERFNKPVQVYVRVRGRDIRVHLDDEVRKKVVDAVKGAREILSGGLVPCLPATRGKCYRCPLRNAC